MRARITQIIGFVVTLQTILFLTHYLLYETWTLSSAGSDVRRSLWLKLFLAVSSMSFTAASLLAFRYTNAVLRAFYRAAAVWLGLLTFLFVAAIASWTIFGISRLAGININFHRTVELLFGAALAVGFYAVFNAGWTRITRTTVRLANLPAAWRGRKAALISDVHLGHVRNGRFLRRLIAQDFAGRAGCDFHCRRFIRRHRHRRRSCRGAVEPADGPPRRVFRRRKSRTIRRRQQISGCHCGSGRSSTQQ